LPRPTEYKELTYPQLRSLCETARLQGMSAAAASLGVAQPTVWKQIHCLEQHLGVPLVEPHSRGCRLTAAGELLVRMSEPLLTDFESLLDRFRTALGNQARKLTVSATPRPFDEELLPCVAEFERQFPHVRLVLRQVATRQGVMSLVESGEADIGLCSYRPAELPREIHIEPMYELELVLLVPHGHPLAKVKLSREHLGKYPLLNARGLYADWGVDRLLESAGAYSHSERRIELEMARSIRLYVRNGLGIGIVARPAGMPVSGDVIERPIGHLLPARLFMYACFRKRVSPDSELLGFMGVVRELLNRDVAAQKP
jgi:DNA-binding transcriptional LysR family regulator